MFFIDIRSNDPIFEQIQKQIIRYVNLGILKEHDKLPSVRSLASDLGINPNTVAKAYLELESHGVVYSINKKGVFVDKNTAAKDFSEELNDLDAIVSKCFANKIDIKKVEEVISKYYGGDKDA